MPAAPSAKGPTPRGPRLSIPAPSARRTSEPEAPGWRRAVLATGGALAIGLGLMSLLMYVQPAAPITDGPPIAKPEGRGDAGSAGVSAVSTAPRTWRNVDGGFSEEEIRAANQVAFLSVVSKPLGARVELDGEILGQTPIVRRRRLPRTDYIIRVTKDGYVPWQRVVRPGEDGGLSVSAVLLKKQSSAP